ncbi:MAG: hypothetical protein ACK56I_12485, partial [bacterium]
IDAGGDVGQIGGPLTPCVHRHVGQRRIVELEPHRPSARGPAREADPALGIVGDGIDRRRLEHLGPRPGGKRGLDDAHALRIRDDHRRRGRLARLRCAKPRRLGHH